MKLPSPILIAGLSILSTGIAAAKTITVDNKPGSVAMYTSVQAACDAAEVNDTILVAGSPIAYGGVTIRKKLHLVGPGYYLVENDIPGVNKSPVILTVVFERLELSSPANSSVTGIAIAALAIPANVPGVSVDRCYIDSTATPQFNLLGQFSITRCYVASNVWLVTGSSVRNSILVRTPVLSSGSTLSHCILLEGLSSAAASSVSNSIFVRTSSITAAAFAATAQGSVTHCLAVGGLGIGGNPTFLPAGAGNVPAIAFNTETFASGLLDKAYLLAPGSPAIGASSSGGNIGAYGGTEPYITSGVPAVPRITRFQVPATATSSSGLHVEMDAAAF